MAYDREKVMILDVHKRAKQDAVVYLKGLEFNELTAIVSGDTLKCSGFINPYVISNESHFFADANIYVTLTELGWSIPSFLDGVFDDDLDKVREYTLSVYTNTSMKNRKVINKDKYGL